MRTCDTDTESDVIEFKVVLTKRQQAQLVCVADELGCALHAVPHRLVIAGLETFGHHPRGRVRKENAGTGGI